jgi:hypothetical protein
MTRFQKVFLRDPLGDKVYAAAFGKHPAWDDHIDDVGLVTETMVLAKQLLYSQGIANQLATGAWDQMERSGQAIEFDHRFVWARKGQSMIGAIYASSDGKGRARFPMVICIQVPVSGLRAVQIYLPQVEKLGIGCKAAKTREDFCFAVDQSNNELNKFRILSGSQLAVAHPEVVGETVVIESAANLLKAVSDRRSCRFRLPPVSSRTENNLEFWAGYVERHIGPVQPFLLICATGEMPVDFRIGEPDLNDWFGLRVTATALPITRPKEAVSSKSARVARGYFDWFQLGAGAQPEPHRSWWGGLFGRQKT